MTSDNRIFIAGGNYIYHEYKVYSNFSKNLDPGDNKSSLRESEFDFRWQSRLSYQSPFVLSGENFLSKEVYEYDNIHDAWMRRSNMLFAKANFSLCAFNNKLYSFGMLGL